MTERSSAAADRNEHEEETANSTAAEEQELELAPLVSNQEDHGDPTVEDGGDHVRKSEECRLPVEWRTVLLAVLILLLVAAAWTVQLLLTRARKADTDVSVMLPEPVFNASCVPTALASYPGSGSTLSRLLLEMSTGVWTGSIYGDKSLWMASPHAFLGENTTTSVVAVKTHGPWHHQGTFDTAERAILMVRHPLRALPSLANYLYGGQHQAAHSLQATKEFWETWRRAHVPAEMMAWTYHFSYWMDRFCNKPHNLLVASYEDLLDDQHGPTVLASMVRFLGFGDHHTEQTIRPVWQKVLQEASAGIHRNKTYTPTFTNDMHLQVVQNLTSLYNHYEANETVAALLETYVTMAKSYLP